MSEDQKNSPEEQKPPQNARPVILVPKSFYYIVGAIVVGSFALTLFVRNPYTQAVTEGGGYYERGGMDSSMMMWLAIFVGIPASFWAYKRWIIPLFDRK
ncbi:hypothetical protein LG047_17120 [Methylocystis sp. WRRC1]|uniref:hypothetical protein n=1 Tax=unclassified Methylocystis TaxID=2625913 RepID=UPI0001F88012|nr:MULTISPECIES: hypothetical protein [unclassified Methylocystis]MCC3247018.1 hypothetical protein [Methylocystis sp. WRRC1]